MTDQSAAPKLRRPGTRARVGKRANGEGAAPYRRANGRWEAKVVDVDGKRRGTYGKTARRLRPSCTAGWPSATRSCPRRAARLSPSPPTPSGGTVTLAADAVQWLGATRAAEPRPRHLPEL